MYAGPPFLFSNRKGSSSQENCEHNLILAFGRLTLGAVANAMAQNYKTITNEVWLTVLPILRPGTPPSAKTEFSS